jgi:hypothetical protein
MGEANQHLKGHFAVPGAAGFVESHLTDGLATDGHAMGDSDSLTQSYVCVLRLSAAGAVICMLPRWT